MVSAMQKGTPAADALSRARSTPQNAQAGAAKITEEEKVFTSRVRLSSLLSIAPLRQDSAQSSGNSLKSSPMEGRPCVTSFSSEGERALVSALFWKLSREDNTWH